MSWVDGTDWNQHKWTHYVYIIRNSNLLFQEYAHEKLRNHVLPYFVAIRYSFLLMHDKAISHAARLVRNMFKAKTIKGLEYFIATMVNWFVMENCSRWPHALLNILHRFKKMLFCHLCVTKYRYCSIFSCFIVLKN